VEDSTNLSESLGETESPYRGGAIATNVVRRGRDELALPFEYENGVLWLVLQVREAGQALRRTQETVLLLIENYANHAR